ncbi:transporter substrate-binding domain-containing protein [Brucella intermedia]|uniref:transporter substrate-binding domain-containing protein n=1 Tax=Brucella intermedia TaxID=94625 RepID=UPI002248BFDE|nr:transporter substrate-binding domain-containing protein [Brucella intermedia]
MSAITTFKRLVFSGVLLLATASMAYAEDGVLRIGTEGDAPRFSMADADGNVSGYDADIANELCAHLKLKCKFVVQTFSSLIPSMDSDRFDVIISGLGITAEREKKIDFSIPYHAISFYFVVPKSSPAAGITDIDALKKALKGKSVGVVNGTTYAKYIQKNFPDVDLKTYDATAQQQEDLANGRLDAAFSDAPTWVDFLSVPANAGFARVNIKFNTTNDPTTLGRGTAVGMRKGNTELKAKIDGAICTMLKDGNVRTASMKWFGEDFSLPCEK